MQLRQQSARDSVELVARHSTSIEFHKTTQPLPQTRRIPLPWNSPDILRRTGIRFQQSMSQGSQYRGQVHTPVGEHSHGSERNRKEADSTPPQLEVALSKVNVARAGAVVAQTTPANR